MAIDSSQTSVRVDADGVRLVEAPAVRRAVQIVLLAAAGICLLAAVAIVLIRLPRRHSAIPPARSAPAGEVAGVTPQVHEVHPGADAAPAPARRPAALRATRRAVSPEAKPGAARPDLQAKDVIPGLIASGETGGIAVFPLPGTKPVKRGIVVPEDFVLPEGYVRHHQMTDDGERLPPILMFHPDYQFVDEHGAPVTLPEDRVVPPDMAPPGLPIRLLDLPAKPVAAGPDALSSRRALAALAAVAASALAFGLYARMTRPWVVLGWVGLVPWLAVLDRAGTVRAALGAGLLMSLAFVVAVFGWFAPAIRTYTGAPPAVAWLLLLVAAPLLEPQLLTFALARHLARRAAVGFWHMTLAGAFAYVGTEWTLPKLFGDTLGHGLYASAWMRQAADLGGAPGLTLVLLIANECVLAALRRAVAGGGLRHAVAPATCAVALALGLLGYGALRCRQLAPDVGRGGAVTAGIVQANIAHYDRLRAQLGTYAAVRTILDAHSTLSTAILGRRRLDLLVWPETVYPTTFGTPKSAAGAAFDREIAAFVAHAGVPLVFGAYEREDGREFNAAVFLEPAEGTPLAFQTYRKASLFPLTERVPVALDSARLRRWLPWLGTWTAGAGPRVVALALPDGRRLRIAPLICYDVLDPRLALAATREGAELIVTLSNDSWFATGAGPRLHLVGAAFRSIETRRPQLRATNTGISAIIAPTGEVLDAVGVDQRGTLVGTVWPEKQATTLMLAWGDWLGPSALAGGLVLIVAGRWRRSSQRL